MDGEQLVGLLTAAQVTPIARTEWGKVRVREAMLAADRLRIVGPNDDLTAALRALDSVGLDYAPVLEDGHLIGMLNRRDITYRT